MNRQYPCEALYQGNVCGPERWDHSYPYDSYDYGVGFVPQIPPYTQYPPLPVKTHRQPQFFPRMRKVYQEKCNFDSSFQNEKQPQFLTTGDCSSLRYPEENMVHVALNQPLHPYGHKKYYEDQYSPANYRRDYDPISYGYENFDDSIKVNNQQPHYTQPELLPRGRNYVPTKYQRHTYVPSSGDYIQNQYRFNRNQHCKCPNQRFRDNGSCVYSEHTHANNRQFQAPYNTEFYSYYNENSNSHDEYYGFEYKDNTSVRKRQQEPIYCTCDEFYGYPNSFGNANLPNEDFNCQYNLYQNNRVVKRYPEQSHFQNQKANQDSYHDEVTNYNVNDSRILLPTANTFCSVTESRNQNIPKNANIFHQTDRNQSNCGKNKIKNKSMNGPNVNNPKTANASTQKPSWGGNEVDYIDSKNETKHIDLRNMKKDMSKKLFKDNFLGQNLQEQSLFPLSDYENRKSKTPFHLSNTVGKSKSTELLTESTKDTTMWNEREGSFGRKMPTRVIDPLLFPKPKMISSNTKVNNQNAQKTLQTLDVEVRNKPIPNQTSSNQKYKSKYINDLIAMKRKVSLEQGIQEQEEKFGIADITDKIIVDSVNENNERDKEGKTKINTDDCLNESIPTFYENEYGRNVTTAKYPKTSFYSDFRSINASAKNQKEPRIMRNSYQNTEARIIPLPPPQISQQNCEYTREDKRSSETENIQQGETNKCNLRTQSIPLPPPAQPMHHMNQQFLGISEVPSFSQSNNIRDGTQQEVAQSSLGGEHESKIIKPPMNQYPHVSKDVYLKNNNVIEEMRNILKNRGLWDQN